MELCSALTERRTSASSSPEVISVLQSQCPAPGFTQRAPVQLTGRQYYGILLLARYVACVRDGTSEHFSLVLEFLQGVPSIVKDDSAPEDVDSYFEELLKYVAEVARVCPDVSIDASKSIAGFVQRFVADEGSVLAKENSSLTRALFLALAKGCPTLIADDAELVAQSVLTHWMMRIESPSALFSPQEFTANGESPTLYHSPESNGTVKTLSRDPSSEVSFEGNTSEGNSFHTPKSSPSKFSPGTADSSGDSVGHCDSSGGSTGHKTNGVIKGHSDKSNGMIKLGRKLQAAFEAETLDALERQDLAIRLFAQVLEQTRDSEPLVLQLRAASIRQLRDVASLLKVLDHYHAELYVS